ncbi:maleylacetate reductase [Actinoplanes sp. OR16]|uniref:maleylacetate reductase n=1 Tax=Actinoplanes sp. OR16 TaxID=946334 RepID=UPI000F6C83A1|nr:maleylacetate reductase [Actinoplanes sp. OR16]BBH69747.1 maleylacetate reductase [Actinoplanes sp. OR16]
MSLSFTHETLPQRIVFGSVTALADEVARFGSRPFLIASERSGVSLPHAVRHTEVVMHVPVEVAARAREAAAAAGVDVLVSVGGGSAVGLAKAVALTSGLPIVAVPTTYAGSEVTPIWGMTENGRKTTGPDPRVLPRTVIYDAELTRSLPGDLAVASGLNALAHAVEAMWAPRTDPINRAFALEAIHYLRAGLPLLPSFPGRQETLLGAHLAAVAFASAGSGLHHKICHALGGMYNLPHAQTHAVVLPYVLALNAPAVTDRLAQAFGAASALTGLLDLYGAIGAPRSLRSLGLAEEAVPAVVDAVLPAVPPGNPVPVTAANLTALLRRAWSGEDPR